MKYFVKTSRRARRVRIAVQADASVVVTAPVYFSAIAVERLVAAQGEWIAKAVERFQRQGPRVCLPRGRKSFLAHKERAREVAARQLQSLNIFYNFSYQRVAIKNHLRRWGSCSKKGNLNFNYRIALLPEPLAEYIVAHELCHLREMNHSRRFWRLVAQTIPDFKLRIRQLRAFV